MAAVVSAEEFTTEQITDAIARAVREHEFDVIPGLVRLLAWRDPGLAQRVLDALHGRITLTFDLTAGAS